MVDAAWFYFNGADVKNAQTYRKGIDNLPNTSISVDHLKVRWLSKKNSLLMSETNSELQNMTITQYRKRQNSAKQWNRNRQLHHFSVFLLKTFIRVQDIFKHPCLYYNWEYNRKHCISFMFFTQSCLVNFLRRTLGFLVQNFAKIGLLTVFLIKIAKLGLPTMVFLIKINLASLLWCFW